MEEKMEVLKHMMETEKEKRAAVVKVSKEGTMWGSATTKKKIAGYGNNIVDKHRIAQPNLPPTTLITDPDNGTYRATQQKKMPAGGSKGFAPKVARPPSGQAAASNISQAVKVQSTTYEEVDQFLFSINLSKYVDTFIDNGIEDLETILELDEKHLEQMTVPLGHKLKIMKKIKDTRKEKGYVDAQPVKVTAEVQYQDGISSRPFEK